MSHEQLEMECPICHEEYGHAPYCPIEMEIEDAEDEYKKERKQALKALKRAKASPQPAAQDERMNNDRR